MKNNEGERDREPARDIRGRQAGRERDIETDVAGLRDVGAQCEGRGDARSNLR